MKWTIVALVGLALVSIGVYVYCSLLLVHNLATCL